MAISSAATVAWILVWAIAQYDERTRVGRVREEEDAKRPEPVGHGAPDRRAREPDDGREREEQRRKARREVTHVVQVDDEQRQGEAVADAADEHAGVKTA